MTKQVLIYDYASTPKGKTLKEIVALYEDRGLVFYDSQAHGNIGGVNNIHPPMVVNIPDGVEIKFIDVAKDELPDFYKDNGN
jgi:hypothetical protein